MMQTVYNLIPNDSHKSFYGKAKVMQDENGTKTLYSYNTKILSVDTNGNLKKYWSGYTVTTQRHIKAFCGLNKKEYESLPLYNEVI